MTKSLTLGLCLSFLCVNLARAQFFSSESYDWQNAGYQKVSQSDSSEISYILDKRLYHYHYQEDGSLIMDRLIHRKVYLHSMAALESYNKFYLPSGENEQLLSFKARAISPKNESREINEKDIQTGRNNSNEREYTYFAIDGLETEYIVEYFYINRLRPKTDGIAFEHQRKSPVLRYELDVISPQNLVFKSKVYNLNQEFVTDTTLEDENRINLHVDSIPKFEDEPVAANSANVGYFVFALDHNRYNNKRDITSYNYTAQNLVNYINRDYDKKDRKALDKLAKKIKSSQPKEEYTLGVWVDHYCKDNFRYLSRSDPEYYAPKGIVSKKAYNKLGGLSLYTQVLKRLAVPYEIVYTCNRNNLRFDHEFESNTFLQELLIYLPEQDIYLDHTDIGARNGITNFNYTGNDALFIEEVVLNDKPVAITEVREIPFRPASYTVDTIEIELDFDESLTESSIEVFRSLTGYSARSYQAIWEQIRDPNDRKKFEESLLSYIDEEADVELKSIENTRAKNLGKKPLRARGTISKSEILGRAGNNILIDIGKLIGPQMELYYERTERKFDIESPFARTYHRKIQMRVPEDYTINNIEELNMEEKLIWGGEERGIFKSQYKLKDDTLEVLIYEYYEDLIVPKEHFGEYARVINAAADFNKIQLVLQKS